MTGEGTFPNLLIYSLIPWINRLFRLRMSVSMKKRLWVFVLDFFVLSMTFFIFLSMDFSAWNNLFGITLGDSWHHNSGTPKTKWGRTKKYLRPRFPTPSSSSSSFLGRPLFEGIKCREGPRKREKTDTTTKK